MFGIGLPELFVIALVATAVIGPSKMPEVARQAARWTRLVRQMADSARRDLAVELSDFDISSIDPRPDLRGTLDRVGEAISPPNPSAEERRPV